ncbi:vacuolar iron transporter homolog 4-like [Amaranthus tricolor]|uniref:vacuolar iron transporter homolog 4-like n=1 Tax=Amaranthus tricolor TaxID=29722 RepID=UPI0025860154|nr:vacuolar iron transporter homolog 4-like [Amaranthus tricolor]
MDPHPPQATRTRRNSIELETVLANNTYEEPNNHQQIDAKQTDQTQDFDYTKRAQWLRAAVLGANDGLMTTASLMMGVGAVKQDMKAMILTGFAGLVAAACSMAIGEFVSVHSQRDIEVAQRKRESKAGNHQVGAEAEEGLPNPIQAAFASALAVAVGSLVPLLAALGVKNYKVRLGVVPAAVTVALLVFGWLGAYLGRASPLRASFRVLLGGWFAMAITFGLTKFIGSRGF